VSDWPSQSLKPSRSLNLRDVETIYLPGPVLSWITLAQARLELELGTYFVILSRA